jgi:transposase, IS30 family
MILEKCKRLSLEERFVIETLLKEKKSKSYIAKRLNRARSTLTREINKWVQTPRDSYNAKLAHWCVIDDNQNKRIRRKIDLNPLLKIYVYRGLLNNWSPEQISGRIKEDFPNDSIMSISHEAIYQHIYSRPQAKMNKKLIALLPFHKSRRWSTKGSAKRKHIIKDRVCIENRPEHIEERKEIGHWEGDLMIGIKQGSAIGTLVERKTRFTYILKLANKKSNTVTSAFSKALKLLGQNWRKTLTYDNGVEMAYHKKLTAKTGMDVYFAHPYSSWERGTNENTNGLIRRYLPKGTNFHHITEQQLMNIQHKLNNRPRKILGYKTPLEAMKQCA